MGVSILFVSSLHNDVNVAFISSDLTFGMFHFRGGYNNLAYTFGGAYNGFGDRTLPSSYTNSVVPGVSNDPRRVNAAIYQHLATKSSCLAVPAATPTTNPKLTPAKKSGTGSKASKPQHQSLSKAGKSKA